MSSDTASDQLLEALKREVIKLHNVYDGSDRLIERYETFANTKHGGPCIKTTYSYVGITTLVAGMKEETAAWDSAWDI